VDTYLIGVSGKAGAGKDTIADSLVKYAGFFKASFALPLKIEGMVKMGFTRSEVFETKPPHVRHWLQTYGDGQRKADPEYWIRKLDSLIQGRERVVISDVRYPNEVEYVQRRGGRVIRVLHAGRPYPLEGTPAAEHISETALDGLTLTAVPNPKGFTEKDLFELTLRLTFPQLLI